MDAAPMRGAFSLRVPLCGLPCSELRIAPDAPEGAGVSGGCPAGRAAASLPTDGGATPTVAGRPTSEADAVEAATALFLGARSPFVFGLSLSSCGTARRAAAIARLLGGAIDVEGGESIENDLRSLRTFGLASATFGEVSRRSDVVLLWRCDPRADHPHLLPPRLPGERSAERLFVLAPPAGEASGTGSPKGHAVGGAPALVSPAGLSPAGAATLLLPVVENGDLDALLALVAFASGREPAAGASGHGAGGVLFADLHRAAAALRRARHAAIVWDAAATRGPGGAAIAAALALLARDLDSQRRAAARPLGAGGNVAGVMASLLAECGHPRAVGFPGGSAREAPETFGAAPMLGGGADALLLIGAVGVQPAPPSRFLRHAVVIGPRLPDGCDEPEVFIPTAVPAFSEKGLWLRADGVPVPMRAPLPSTRPTESDVLDRLIGRLVVVSGKPRRSVTSRHGASRNEASLDAARRDET